MSNWLTEIMKLILDNCTELIGCTNPYQTVVQSCRLYQSLPDDHTEL